MLIFCDFIQVYVFTTNHHLNNLSITDGMEGSCLYIPMKATDFFFFFFWFISSTIYSDKKLRLLGIRTKIGQ